MLTPETISCHAEKIDVSVSKQMWIALLVAVVAFFAYMANGRWIGAIDNFTTRYVPLSVVREGNTTLDEFPGLVSGDPIRIRQAADGHYYSRAPLTTAYLAAPIYWAAEVFGLGPRTATQVDRLAKVSAALISAASCGIMTLILSRFLQGWRLVVLCIAYALGSPMWPVASQDLWILTSSQFFAVLLILCLVRGLDQPHWILVAFAPLALTILCRPQQIVAAVPVVLYIVLFYRRQSLQALPLGLAVAILVWVFKPTLFGDFYGQMVTGGFAEIFRFEPLYLVHVLTRQLFDLSHGVLVYSPYIGLGLYGVLALRHNGRLPGHAPVEKSQRFFLLCLLVAALYLLFYSSFVHWRGGWSVTNRYFLDALPYAIMLLVPVLHYRPTPRLVSCIVAFLVVVAVLLNGMVAFWVDLEWLSFYLLGDGHETQDYALRQSLLYYVGRKALGDEGPIIDRDGQWLPSEPYQATGNLIPIAPVQESPTVSHLWSGWCSPESFGVWSCFAGNFPIAPVGPPFGQDRAVLVVSLEPGKDHSLRFGAQPYCNESNLTQSLRVRYNGHHVGDFSLPCRSYWEPYVLEAVVPASWISGRADRLEFSYFSFAEGDLANATRRLAVAFTEVTFTPR